MKCEKTHKVLLARDAKTSYENITLLLENLGLDLRVAKFPKTSVEITFKQNRPFSADSNLFLTTLKQFDTHGNVNLSPHFDYLEKHAQGYQI